MTTRTRPTTAEELLNMRDDRFRYELIRGELRGRPFVGQTEGSVSAMVGAHIGMHVKKRGLGVVTAATGFELESDPDHVRSPNLAFVRRDRDEAAGPTPGFFPGPPDIAIEVVSQSDGQAYADDKVADWLDAGTLAVIVVDPRRRTVKVHRSPTEAVVLTDEDALTVEDAVPGWKLPVRDIFE